MRVLVYPHDLAMGGSQTNAIEIAAAMRPLGVEPVVFGLPGALCTRIEELGLDFVACPSPGPRPSPRVARVLTRLARSRRLDVLHGYEWPPSLECAAAAAATRGARAVSTVMSMAVPPFLPRTNPLVVGTDQIRADCVDHGRSRTHLLEPPVDLDHNVPSSQAEQAAFRRRWQLDADRALLVCVTRLADELKSEGLLSAITAVSGPLAHLGVQLLVVGDGPARERIAHAAAAANAASPGSVVLTGELLDPRTAYSVADVVLGMGGSALRALAFGKPLVVQGEQGFFRLLDETSLPLFLWQGWYGVGDDASAGPARLTAILEDVLQRRDREALGRLGRSVVVERFSVQSAARTQLRVYEQALAARPGPHAVAVDALGSAAGVIGYHLRRRAEARSGRQASDDFNARPLAAAGSAVEPAPAKEAA